MESELTTSQVGYAELNELKRQLKATISKWISQYPYDFSIGLRQVIFTAHEVYDSQRGMKGYHIDRNPTEYADWKTRETIRNTTIPASVVAYSINKPKCFRKKLSDARDNTSEVADQSFKQILALSNYTLGGAPNNSTFVSPLYPQISATPDGIVLLDGILCPIEVKTKNSKSDNWVPEKERSRTASVSIGSKRYT